MIHYFNRIFIFPFRLHTVGKKIPILSERKLYKDPPDFVILFSWHIASELKKNLKKKGYRGKFIIPLPFPKIEG